jgi:hypothetical protein
MRNSVNQPSQVVKTSEASLVPGSTWKNVSKQRDMLEAKASSDLSLDTTPKLHDK